MRISESFYQNLHLPLSETWCERVITLLRVGDRPVVRNSHTGSQAPSAGRMGMCQALQLVKVQAYPLLLTWCSGTISKELAIAYRKEIESQFPFGDQFSRKSFIVWKVSCTQFRNFVFSWDKTPKIQLYWEPWRRFLLAAPPSFHILFCFLLSIYSYKDISLSLGLMANHPAAHSAPRSFSLSCRSNSVTLSLDLQKFWKES